MTTIVRTMSPESHAIETLCRSAEQAARAGDFPKADACLSYLASDPHGRFFTEAVAQFIRRAREAQERAA